MQLAISSRLQYQFSGGIGGGLSKEFLVETAQQRNRVQLPRVLQHEWGSRLPSERFVLSGVPWGLREEWEEEVSGEEVGDVMEGVQAAMEEQPGVEATEGGDMADLFGEDVDEDMEKEE